MRHRSISAAALCALFVQLVIGSSVEAAIESRAILKTYFETGNVPTESQFGSLIDSMVNYTDDRDIIGLRVYNPSAVYQPGDTVVLKRFGIGDTAPANPAEYVNPHVNPVDLATDFGGHLGFLGVQFRKGADTFYGFLQIEMQDPLVHTPPGIDVHFVVYETTPNTPVMTFLVPEPGGVLAAMTGCLLCMRRRSSRRRR